MYVAHCWLWLDTVVSVILFWYKLNWTKIQSSSKHYRAHQRHYRAHQKHYRTALRNITELLSHKHYRVPLINITENLFHTHYRPPFSEPKVYTFCTMIIEWCLVSFFLTNQLRTVYKKWWYDFIYNIVFNWWFVHIKSELVEGRTRGIVSLCRNVLDLISSKKQIRAWYKII